MDSYICRESEQNFPPRVLLKLVDEAEGTPVFVSAVTKTGFVIVEVIVFILNGKAKI
jgi:hypothetical protein